MVSGDFSFSYQFENTSTVVEVAQAVFPLLG